jgi:superfamily II DNA or RNA helicase
MATIKIGVSRKKSKPIKLKVPRTHKPEDLSVEDWQRALRKQFGEQQIFTLRNNGDHPVFSEFSLTNPASGKTYRLAIRGRNPGDNYCSCPDFSINNLGTCKHLAFALAKLGEKPGAKRAFKAGFAPPYSEVFLHYGLRREIRFRPGADAPAELRRLARNYFDAQESLKPEHILDVPAFVDAARRIDKHEVRCYDDVMAFVAERQDEEHRRGIVAGKLRRGIHSAAFHNLLKAELYPYQKEGALFAVRAGRCLIGDDMGLGKTIQALAAAELMRRLFSIGKVLIVAPTSLKHQWRTEIEKFTGKNVSVVEGLNAERARLYQAESFYKVINYEVVFRDLDHIKTWSPDLIILDEAQRIKNWNTRTAKAVKRLESTFALVLTGTPLENRIEELHSIVEFVDRFHLGPLYRFVHNHRMTDGGGKVTGYRNLRTIRESLQAVMLRRTKNEVLRQLPGRTDKNFFVPLTREQFVIHDEYRELVAQLVAKWRRFKFLSDADQKRLMMALNLMRMVSDNTYLVDKKTVHGPKIEELEIVLRELVVESGEKVVVFTQWLRMAELVREVLKRNNIGYTQLHGGVPSKQRRDLISKFREDPACRVFLSTDAGGVGLNLQAGSVVINMDIPWNPAVLEQRIGRVHRMGQKKPVRVINFVTSGSIEERILELLAFKKSVFAGALDEGGQDTVTVGESKLNALMRTVETMTQDIPQPDPAAERQKRREEELAEKEVRKGPVRAGRAAASTPGNGHRTSSDSLNELFQTGARFLSNLGDMLAQSGEPLEKRLQTMIGKDDATGGAYVKVPLPETESIKAVFTALGELLSHAAQAARKAE